MINDIMSFLETKYTGDGYYAQEFMKNVFFGVDKENNIICLKKVNGFVEKTKLKTNCLELLQNFEVTINLENGSLTDSFNIIICNKRDDIETFVRLCLCYLSDNNNNEMLDLMKNLIELFQITASKNSDFEKGLWGELFVIYYLFEYHKIDISKNWHNDFYLKYDFSLSDDTKIEVKTTSNANRIHRVNHEQVYTNNNVILASVMVRKDDEGLSVFDLFERIKPMFEKEYDKIIECEKLLRKVNYDSCEKYELNYALDNIRFFDIHSIPKFDMKEPEGVYRTEYDIDLSNIIYISDDRLHEIFDLEYTNEE